MSEVWLSLCLCQCELAASEQTSDNLLKTQLDGLRIGFLWLSVLLKYHYREAERRETRDKETNTHRHREKASERERERDKTEGEAEQSASGIKE